MTRDTSNIAHRSETLNIVVLSLSALAITWCSYQSTLWSGIQTFRLARANAAYREAQEKLMRIIEHQILDGSVVVNFMNAVAANDTGKQRMYIERSRPEVGQILQSWAKQDPMHNKKVPVHPGATDEYRTLTNKSFAEVNKLKDDGGVLWDEAEQANMNSDNYVLITVVFSVIMFFCGVTAKLTNLQRAWVMNIISACILAFMLVVLITKMPYATRVM